MPKAKSAPVGDVRESYRRHDEVESNPLSRRRFAAGIPILDDRQREIVARLDADGFAVTSVAELFSPATWAELLADAHEYTTYIERKLAGWAAAGKDPRLRKPGKPGKLHELDETERPAKEKFYMARRFKKAPLGLDSPWLRLGSCPRMLDIVNSYLGMWSKLSYADQWYTPPRGEGADRLGSMRWHRDYNDQHLVKVFVYLVDVDAPTGPFQYVPGSARGGRWANEWPWSPAGETYPPPEEFHRRIPESAVATVTAPAGSMIFCNTSGFHRGGHATAKPRSIFVFNYVSPAGLEVLVDRNFDVGDAAGLADVQRFALT
jgi:hypothetical protein